VTATQQTAARVHRPERGPTAGVVIETVAMRSGRKLMRSMPILGISVIQSLVFLFMFRYVLGGAIGVAGFDYVDFLVPGFVIAGMLFTAGGGAVGTAEDAESGLFDRLRSLPISASATLVGKILADAVLIGFVALVTLGVGFLVGFRLSGSIGEFLFALVLLVPYALTVACLFTLLGMVSGSAQAAQGLSILAVPFSFISSAFVPISTMPQVLQWIADWQPLTFMVNSWRGLMLGDDMVATFDHSLGFYIVGSLVWCVALAAAGLFLALRAYRKE
jgi:ABC-2 type transport system permease protein